MVGGGWSFSTCLKNGPVADLDMGLSSLSRALHGYPLGKWVLTGCFMSPGGKVLASVHSFRRGKPVRV